MAKILLNKYETILQLFVYYKTKLQFSIAVNGKLSKRFVWNNTGVKSYRKIYSTRFRPEEKKGTNNNKKKPQNLVLNFWSSKKKSLAKKKYGK